MLTEDECRKILHSLRKRLRRSLPNGYRFDDDVARGISLPITPPSDALRAYLKQASLRLCLRRHPDFPGQFVRPEISEEGCGYYVIEGIDEQQLLQNPPEAMLDAEKKIVEKMTTLRNTIGRRLND